MAEFAETLDLSDLLLRAIRRHGAKTALRKGAESLSYDALYGQALRLAGYLQCQGVRAGDRVALHLRNSLEYLVSDVAILMLRATKVPLNELMSVAEIRYCLGHAKVKAFISDMIRPPAPGVIAIARDRGDLDGDSSAIDWFEALEAAPPDFDWAPPDPESTAVIIYTGGTTGRPKGVRHLSGRMAQNILATVICADIRSDEVMLISTPLPHSGGFFALTCLLQGGEVVLLPKFDARDFLSLAAECGATWTFAVPTMLYRILDALPERESPPSTLRTIVYGAAPMSRERLDEALLRFGTVFIQIYGQTECPNFITTLTKSDHLDPALRASCGRAVPFCELMLVDADGGPTPPGEVGEVAVSSPYLLCEYLDDPKATAAAGRDGFLKTGDLGYLNDAGYLFLVDRAKDMIISGGFNVYSVEVEAVLRQHPAVREAAVVGLPDPDWGERVVATVVAEGDVEAADLIALCRAGLAAYKVPKAVTFTDDLPLTTYGKIDKKAIRARLESAAPTTRRQ